MPQEDITKKLLKIEDPNIELFDELKECIEDGTKVLYLYGRLTYQPKACKKCGVVNESSKDIIKHGSKTSTIILNPNNHRKVKLELKKQRFLCKHCHKTFVAETKLVDRHCFISNSVKESITMELTEVQSMTFIAKRYHVSTHTVTRTLDASKDQFHTKYIYLPQHLAIDEFRSVKKAMSFIFVDARNHRLIDIVEERTLSELESYFLRYPKESRFAVQTVCMDMYSPYFSLVKRCFPNAEIIIDRFHIVQHLNRALNQVRVQVMNEIRYKRPSDYRKLKKLWKLFLKNEDDLDYTNYFTHRLFTGYVTEKRIVQYMCSIHPKLDLVYKLINEAKQTIRDHHYKRFVKTIDQSKKFQLPRKVRTTFQTMERYKSEIFNSCLYNLSNGPVEGLINKIKNLKRSGYGYRNFSYFRTRLCMIFKLKTTVRTNKALYY